mmetsp:Transcript_11535/g.40319  ORF Transcript_11535/g.40319 Transcript_11535/m.40319 type:complete len:255 (-) Transcript_11535:405-1169(-)
MSSGVLGSATSSSATSSRNCLESSTLPMAWSSASLSSTSSSMARNARWRPRMNAICRRMPESVAPSSSSFAVSKLFMRSATRSASGSLPLLRYSVSATSMSSASSSSSAAKSAQRSRYVHTRSKLRSSSESESGAEPSPKPSVSERSLSVSMSRSIASASPLCVMKNGTMSPTSGSKSDVSRGGSACVRSPHSSPTCPLSARTNSCPHLATSLLEPAMWYLRVSRASEEPSAIDSTAIRSAAAFVLGPSAGKPS